MSACQDQIESLTYSAEQLRNKIAAQEDVLRSFSTKQDYYLEELAAKQTHEQNIYEHHERVVFAELLRAKAEDNLSKEKLNLAHDALDLMCKRMRDEIERHIAELEEQEAALRQANDTLSQLNYDYNCARQDEEERERAANQQNTW
jgi:hypothetical protein